MNIREKINEIVYNYKDIIYNYPYNSTIEEGEELLNYYIGPTHLKITYIDKSLPVDNYSIFNYVEKNNYYDDLFLEFNVINNKSFNIKEHKTLYKNKPIILFFDFNEYSNVELMDIFYIFTNPNLENKNEKEIYEKKEKFIQDVENRKYLNKLYKNYIKKYKNYTI